MKTRSILLLVFAGLAAATVLPSCNPGSGSGSGGTGGALTVGFAQVGAESDWRVAETASITDEAKARGIDLKFSDAAGKQENQIKAIQSFIAQGVDAIILAPKVEDGWKHRF
ncbi:MAG: substrate-binding domain-containing protein [Verrucomicrobiales bacterium]